MMKTLIIDDELQAYDCVKNMLGCYDVAETGLIGIEYAETALKVNSYYNLILLDVVIPGLNGIEVIKRLRDLEKHYNIKSIREAKIIVVSSRRDEPAILEAFRNGATGWIEKPVVTDILITKLKNLM
ncbi:MAG TPA: response regulator [Bacteroidales bacterium]|nr:response regulator [Bacteroidales bacterium]